MGSGQDEKKECLGASFKETREAPNYSVRADPRVCPCVRIGVR
ncbi:MAG: hypothetical protein ACM3SY_10725 [Candidatus Omnitrophota bacterium]